MSGKLVPRWTLLPPETIARAKRGWEDEEPIADLQELLGYATQGGAYRALIQMGCQPRSEAAIARLKRKANAHRTERLPRHEDVQPIVVRATPLRRCGRCLGYTGRVRCHRCGEPAATQRAVA